MTLSKKISDFYGENYMTIHVFGAMVLGIGFAMIIVQFKTDWTDREINYILFPGEINLRALQVFALPHILSLLIVSIGALDLQTTGSITWKTIVYYLATSTMAVFNGMLLVTVIKPGTTGVSETRNMTEVSHFSDVKKSKRIMIDVLMDLVRNLFPPNVFQATFESYQTKINPAFFANGTAKPEHLWPAQGEFKPGINFLGLIGFAIVVGIAINKTGEEAKPFLNFFKSFLKIILVLVRFNIKTAPIGIFFLIFGTVIKNGGDIAGLVGSLLMYIITVASALTIHSVLVLPLLFILLTRRSPFPYIKSCLKIVGTIFGTGSSVATLPVTMATLQDGGFVDPNITGFVIPIGANFNFDGSSLYEAVAVVFLAQREGVELTLANYAMICLTTITVPQGGALLMIMLLESMGLPINTLALIMPIDWLLNRMRSTVNVFGDCMAAGSMQILSKGKFEYELNLPEPRYKFRRDIETFV